MLQPAAQRVAVDRGNHRLRAAVQHLVGRPLSASARGLPNWRMSAPAMKLRPAPIITIALTLGIGLALLQRLDDAVADAGPQRVDRRIVDGDDADPVLALRIARAACRPSAILPGRFPHPRPKECPFFEAASKDKQSAAAFSGSGRRRQSGLASLIDKAHDVVGQAAGGVARLGEDDVRAFGQNDAHGAEGIHLAPVARDARGQWTAPREPPADAHHRPAALVHIDGAVRALDLSREHEGQAAGHRQHDRPPPAASVAPARATPAPSAAVPFLPTDA